MSAVKRSRVPEPFDGEPEYREPLRQFALREHHTDVPVRHVEGGYQLGKAVSDLRRRKRANTLPKEEVRDLNRFPGWAWDAMASRWEVAFEALTVYAEQHGDSRVPFRYVTPSGFRLGHWVSDVRKRQRAGELPKAQSSRFADVPGWTWDGLIPGDATRKEAAQLKSSKQDATWVSTRALVAITSFYNREQHLRVPTSHIEGTFKLGRWVQVQRDQHRRGILPPGRAEHLEQYAGWVWDARDIPWWDRLAELKTYNLKKNDVPKYDTVLGRWILRQRAKHAAGTLTAVQETALEGVPGWAW